MSEPSSIHDRLAPSSHSGKTLSSVVLSPAFLDAIPDATVVADGEGTIVQVNSQAEQMFGYKRGELIGQKIEVLVPQRYRTQHERHRANFSEQPKTRRMGPGLELHGTRRDGAEFPVEISLSPVPTELGTLVLGAVRDISDRKKIEEELRQANEELDRWAGQQIRGYRARLASIIDSSEDAIIGKDLDGVITSWNLGAEHIYGYTADEVLGKSIAVLAPKDRPDEIPGILAKIRRGESVTHFESVRMSKDGRRLNVSITVSPIRDLAGKIVGASAIARDITAQRRAEDQLRQAQKMEAVGRLAGGVAHDFNNTLGIIMACTELLRERTDPNSKGQQYVENIAKAARQGASLTRQLLSFSRKQVVQTVLLDLNERVREVSKLVRPLMGDDVEIVILSRSESALVEADPGQLDQVVLNLAVNARDAMPRGGKFVLETSAVDFDEAFVKQHPPMTPGKYILLAVSDTGIGMDQSTVARVFEPFFTTKEVGKGTGLGLATVYGIVRQAGGHIWVYSEPGRGTTFKIYLPSAEHKVRSSVGPQVETAVPKRHGTKLLLVEDDEMMRQLTKEMLEEHGYTVVEAKDGKSALQLAQSGLRIDLVLTDVVMRGMSGPELSDHMRRSFPDVRVVYMSGYTGELIAEHDVLQSGVALLEKPFTKAALLKTIDEALG